MFNLSELKLLKTEIAIFNLGDKNKIGDEILDSLTKLIRAYFYLLVIQKTPTEYRHKKYQEHVANTRKSKRTHSNKIWDTKIWGNNFSILTNTYLLMIFELANLNQTRLEALSVGSKENFILDWFMALRQKYDFFDPMFGNKMEDFTSDGLRKRIRIVRQQLRVRGVVCLKVNLVPPYQGSIDVELASSRILNRTFSNYLGKTLAVPLDMRIAKQFIKQQEFLAALEPKKIASQAGAQKYFGKSSFDIITKKTTFGIEDSFMLPSENDLQNFILIK